MGRFENFTPPTLGSELTTTEISMIEALSALANSASGEFIRKESGSFVNATLAETISLSGLSDVAFSSIAQGDIAYYNGSSWVNLSAGTSGLALYTRGAGANPEWANTVTSVSVVAANGVSGSVANSDTTPAITLTLGDITPSSVVSTGVVRASANDGAALGASGTGWSDLFLASGAVVNFAAGDMTITHASNWLTFSGGSVGFAEQTPTKVTNFERVVFEDSNGANSDWTFRVAGSAWGVINFAASAGTLGTPLVSTSGDNLGRIDFYGHGGTDYEIAAGILVEVDGTPGNNDMPGRIVFQTTADAGSILSSRVIIDSAGNMKPAADNGTSLGVSGTAWSDLFLASGAVINWVAGDVTLTHAAGKLTFGGDGAVEIDFNNHEMTNVDINSGAIDGVTIGGASAGAITGTAITANTSVLPDADDGATLGDSDQGWSDLYLAAGGNVLVANANAKRTIILTAAGGSPTTTIGCAGPTKIEAGTNDIDYYALEFDTTTEERAFWNVQMPDNYDGSTVTAKFIWTNAAGLTTETVAWGIKAIAYADSGAIDQAYGSEVTTSDTWLAQGDIHISAASTAITIAGSPAGGQYVIFNVGRKVASDNLTGDARLLAVQIEYGINAYSD